MEWLEKLLGITREDLTLSDLQKVRILKILQEKHSVNVTKIEGDDKQYGSMLLEIDKDAKYLILDKLNPSEGHEKVEIGKKFIITSSYQGIAVFYTTHVMEITGNKSPYTYKVEFPEDFKYKQRRDSFRLDLEKNPLKILLKVKNQKIKVDVVDLSFTGLAIISDSPIDVKPGDKLENCELFDYDGGLITLNLKITRNFQNKETEKYSIGGKTADSEKKSLNELNKLILKLQRVQRKKDLDSKF